MGWRASPALSAVGGLAYSLQVGRESGAWGIPGSSRHPESLECVCGGPDLWNRVYRGREWRAPEVRAPTHPPSHSRLGDTLGEEGRKVLFCPPGACGMWHVWRPKAGSLLWEGTVSTLKHEVVLGASQLKDGDQRT